MIPCEKKNVQLVGYFGSQQTEIGGAIFDLILHNSIPGSVIHQMDENVIVCEFFFLKITNAPLWDPSEESPQSDMDGTMEIQTSWGVFHNEVPMPTPPLSNYLLYIPCLSDLLHLPPLCSLSSFHRSTHFLTILPLSSLVSPFSLNKPTSSLTMTSTPSFHSL